MKGFLTPPKAILRGPYHSLRLKGSCFLTTLKHQKVSPLPVNAIGFGTWGCDEALECQVTVAACTSIAVLFHAVVEWMVVISMMYL